MWIGKIPIRSAFDDRIRRALGHAADSTYIGAIVAKIRIDDVSLFGCVGADGITRAGRTAGVTHDAEVWFDDMHFIFFG